MKKIRFYLKLLFALLLTFSSIPSQATAFTSKALFVGASGVEKNGTSGVINFDSLAPNYPLSGTFLQPSDPGVPDVTFPFVTDPFNTPLNLIVVANYGNNPTTTANNSLGTDDPDNYNAIIGGTNILFELYYPANGFWIVLHYTRSDV